jgi:putative ABC transport system ATP-binding protein
MDATDSTALDPQTQTRTGSVTATGAAPFIAVRNIVKSYDDGNVKAVQGVSLSVAEGEFLAIMGASGSGKSTLLHLIGTLDTPDEGEVEFEGVKVADIPRLDLFRAANIGFVFQMHFLLPHLNIVENVALPLEAVPGVSRKLARQRAEDALVSVGLGHRLKHTPNKISGGERQRAAIARAIVNEPSIILADEPTGNVDSVTEGMILDLFGDIQARLGATFVIVTHDSGVADRASRVLVMRDGKLRDEDHRRLGKKSSRDTV